MSVITFNPILKLTKIHFNINFIIIYIFYIIFNPHSTYGLYIFALVLLLIFALNSKTIVDNDFYRTLYRIRMKNYTGAIQNSCRFNTSSLASPWQNTRTNTCFYLRLAWLTLSVKQKFGIIPTGMQNYSNSIENEFSCNKNRENVYMKPKSITCLICQHYMAINWPFASLLELILKSAIYIYIKLLTLRTYEKLLKFSYIIQKNINFQRNFSLRSCSCNRNH